MRRFHEKYVKNCETGCWQWTAAKNKKGYGNIGYGGKVMLSHRVSMILTGQTIPAGAYVLHTCDNPGCVNPDHLYIGDQFDNMRDMKIRGRDRKNPLRGERHGGAKISSENVVEIRSRANAGIVQTEIAKEFGISQGQVSRIKHRLEWASIK